MLYILVPDPSLTLPVPVWVVEDSGVHLLWQLRKINLKVATP